MGPSIPVNVILLSCGSFNPLTNMHLRMFEIAKDHLHRMGQHVVLGGVISPVHDAYGKCELLSSTHRLEMLKLALQNHDWVRLSDWECGQEAWTKTRQVLQYHQNNINALVNQSLNNHLDINENELNWIPDIIKNGNSGPVKVKLLCGADLLESFGTPGLWADEDLEEIVGRHGLVVITRANSNPAEFIYNSDLLTKYMSNITIVTEWITNEISSTRVRRALRRQESVQYILPDKVLEYIYTNNLYGSHRTLQQFDRRTSIDTVDSFSKSGLKHPGQAVKIIQESTGEHKIVCSNQPDKEVCNEEIIKDESSKGLKSSKSFSHFNEIEGGGRMKRSDSNSSLKECKSCDENLIKFIFTKHGIQVISDVETIV